MNNAPGFNIANVPLHIVQRGINREPCFSPKRTSSVTDAGSKNRLAVDSGVVRARRSIVTEWAGRPPLRTRRSLLSERSNDQEHS